MCHVGDAAVLPGQGTGAPQRVQRTDREEAAGQWNAARHEAPTEAVEQFIGRQARETGLDQPGVEGKRIERALRIRHGSSR
jgi:hypothetical protein